MAIKPLGDRVLVKPLEDTEEKIGSLYVPDSAKEKPQEGTVKAVGPGRTEDGKVVAPSVKVGDRVLYGKYSGTEIKQGGEDLLIVRESDILAVID
ncbi:MAG: co-chaperone GroES [Leptospiraceae bacterium]|nr:co-chaperone GroES [Leptospiraceae bacterium]MCB1319126.1 co-chaperone GroES [Leptospiraceae bacterium]